MSAAKVCELYCSEHGHVMTAGVTKSTFQAEVMWFCPHCTRLLVPADQLGKQKQPTQAEWAEHFDGDILRMPKAVLGDAE